MLQKDSLENKCLYKLQTQQKISRGHVNYNTGCYSCNGFNMTCHDYISLQDKIRVTEDILDWRENQ